MPSKRYGKANENSFCKLGALLKQMVPQRDRQLHDVVQRHQDNTIEAAFLYNPIKYWIGALVLWLVVT
jgi:hypothetical protein